MRALYRQGTPMAFYKGNMTRSLHIVLFHKLNTYMGFEAEARFGQQWKALKEVPLLSDVLLAFTVDMLLQPLHVAETRMTIQNRTKNFSVYSSLADFIKQTPFKDMYRGCLVHLPRNFLIALSGLKLRDEITLANYYGQTIMSQTIAYPFMLI